MSRSRSARAALFRSFVVLTVAGSALVGVAGIALAGPVRGLDATVATAPSSGLVIAGVSLGTFVWALAGFGVLALGFIAASRSGRGDAVAVLAGPTETSAVVVEPTGRSLPEAQGESKSSAVTV